MEVVAPRLFSTPRQRPPQAVQSIMGRARARHEVRCAARAVLHGSETDDSELEELSLTSECLDKEELRARKEDIGEALKWITGELVSSFTKKYMPSRPTALAPAPILKL